ncbi:MAG: ATPase P [Lachnospiraceae bacterium]|nr:ATPase P [Lachnospiraceae bacterium]
MLIPPSPLGKTELSKEALSVDLSACKRIGPCGFGSKAIYLGSRYLARRQYLLWDEVERVFKRVAISPGGFTGKGVFGSIAYLVVQYGGQEKQVRFRLETEADQAVEWVSKNRPNIPVHSASAQRKLAEAKALEEARYKKELSPEAETTLEILSKGKKYLESWPDVSDNLVAAAKQKRIADNIKPAVKALASVIAAAGIVAAVYGLAGLLTGKSGAGYFILGGAAAFFTMLSSGTLPSKWNNRRFVHKEWEDAVKRSKKLIEGHDIPVPPQYAHPIVLERMIRVVREGRAETASEALEAVKEDLRALNSSVTVSQREHDEVVVVKPLFLVCDYGDSIDP